MLSNGLETLRVGDRITVYAMAPRDQQKFAADVKTVCEFATEHGLTLDMTTHGKQPAPARLKRLGF